MSKKYNGGIVGGSTVVNKKTDELGTVVDMKFGRSIPYHCTEVQVKWQDTGLTFWIDVKKVKIFS